MRNKKSGMTKLDFNKPASKAAQLGNLTQQEPVLMGPRARLLAFDFYLCRFMPRPCISVRSPGRLLRQLQRVTFFSLPKFQPNRLVAECSATKACISCTKGKTLLSSEHYQIR